MEIQRLPSHSKRCEMASPQVRHLLLLGVYLAMIPFLRVEGRHSVEARLQDDMGLPGSAVQAESSYTQYLLKDANHLRMLKDANPLRKRSFGGHSSRLQRKLLESCGTGFSECYSALGEFYCCPQDPSGMYMCLFTDTTTCVNDQNEEDILTVSYAPRFLKSDDVLMPEVDSKDACSNQGHPTFCALDCGKFYCCPSTAPSCYEGSNECTNALHACGTSDNSYGNVTFSPGSTE